jgi:hypothetical protein
LLHRFQVSRDSFPVNVAVDPMPPSSRFGRRRRINKSTFQIILRGRETAGGTEQKYGNCNEQFHAGFLSIFVRRNRDFTVGSMLSEDISEIKLRR